MLGAGFAPTATPGSAPVVPTQNVPGQGAVLGAPLNSGVAPTRWYIRTTGLNSNGGSDPGPNPQRTVSDGVTNGTATVTSATMAFVSSDVGKGISIAGNRYHKIAAVVNGTTITLDRVTSDNGSARTLRIGGAWQDLRPAIGDVNAATQDTNSPVNGGDEVYVGAGVYRIAGYSVGSNWKPFGKVLFKGDLTGVWTGDAGQVALQPIFAESNAQQGMTTSVNLLTWGTAGTGWYMNFEDIGMYGSFNTNLFSPGSVPPQEVVFRRCMVSIPNTGSGRVLNVTVVGAARFKWLFDRCIMNIPSPANPCYNITGTLGTGQDWDIDITWQNCLIIGGANLFSIASTGSNNGKPGGCKAFSTTSILESGGNNAFINSTAGSSIPFQAYGNMVMGTIGNNAGSVNEDYNILLSGAGTVRPTQGAGGHTLKGDTTNIMFQPIWSIGQEFMWGMKPRPMFEPCDGSITSPNFAWRIGTKDTSAGHADLLGRPRPSSPTAWDAGCYQRWNTAKRTVATVQNSLNALQFTGFGGQDFDIPLDAGSYNFNVWMQYDSNYVGPLPTFEVLGNSAMGIGHYQLPISSAALNNWVQYTIQLNVTAPGVATVRFACRDCSLTQIGNLYVDNFSVS